MSPTRITAALVAVIGISALALPLPLVAVALATLAGLAVADLVSVRSAPAVRRDAPRSLARRVPASLALRQLVALRGRVRVRQPVPPDVELVPSEGDEELEGTLVAHRRGRHRLRPVAARRTGPLRLASRDSSLLEEEDLLVYPDLPAASRLVEAVRRGRLPEQGHRHRGHLGLGTEFESIREYRPDDDIRQVNWKATARLGRPLSNQYRAERDRELICLLDSGRLMGAPLEGATRLDVAVDAVVALAAVADELGDRCGLVAFDATIRRHMRPGRRSARDIVTAVFDLEPTTSQSDYALALQRVGSSKRAFVLVLTDLLEASAASPLVDALPVVARRHQVVVASAGDPDLEQLVEREPARSLDVYRAVVAADVLRARDDAVAALRGTGATVVVAPPARLGAACVQAYLRAKARARL